MFAKYAIAGLAGSALLASVAFAQTRLRPPTPTRPPLPRLRRVRYLVVQGQLARLEAGRPERVQRQQREPRIDQRSADRQERQHQSRGDRRRRLPRRRRASGCRALRQGEVRRRADRLHRRCERTGARRRKPSSTTTTGAATTAPAAAKKNPVVSGSRHVQRDQGSAEGDAGVQVFDRVSIGLRARLSQMAGRRIAARPFCFMGDAAQRAMVQRILFRRRSRC